jgi:serine O-acetyltransferase
MFTIKHLYQKWLQYGTLHGLITIIIYRAGNFIYCKVRIPIVRQLFLAIHKIIYLIVMDTILSCEFPPSCTIGKVLRLPHGGKNIIINRNTVIGDNVTIFHNVTIGICKEKGAPPRIGNNVLIGSGACILGNITIGDNVKIGANSVVLCDIPSNTTATGIPAKIHITP